MEKVKIIKNKGFILPENIECPHCETELELEDDERQAGELQCPECNQWIAKSQINVHASSRSDTQILKKEMNPIFEKFSNFTSLKNLLLSNFIILLLVILFSDLISESIALISTTVLIGILVIFYLFITITSFKYMSGNHRYIYSPELLKNYRWLNWLFIGNLCFLIVTLGLFPTPVDDLSIIGKFFILLVITLVSPIVLYLFLFAVPDSVIAFYSRLKKSRTCEICGRIGQEVDTGIYYFGAANNTDIEGRTKACKNCQFSSVQKFMAISPLISIITIVLGTTFFPDAEFNFIFLVFVLYWFWSFLYVPIKFMVIKSDTDMFLTSINSTQKNMGNNNRHKERLHAAYDKIDASESNDNIIILQGEKTKNKIKEDNINVPENSTMTIIQSKELLSEGVVTVTGNVSCHGCRTTNKFKILIFANSMGSDNLICTSCNSQIHFECQAKRSDTIYLATYPLTASPNITLYPMIVDNLLCNKTITEN